MVSEPYGSRNGSSADSSSSLQQQKKMAAISNAVSMTQQIVPIFKGENYHFWSTKMKTLFLSNDLWDLVENDITICDVEKLTAA